MAKNRYRIHKDGTVWRSGDSIWHHWPSRTKELIKIGRLEGNTLILHNDLMCFIKESDMARSLSDFATEKGITEIVSHSSYVGYWLCGVISRANKTLKYFENMTIQISRRNEE